MRESAPLFLPWWTVACVRCVLSSTGEVSLPPRGYPSVRAMSCKVARWSPVWWTDACVRCVLSSSGEVSLPLRGYPSDRAMSCKVACWSPCSGCRSGEGYFTNSCLFGARPPPPSSDSLPDLWHDSLPSGVASYQPALVCSTTCQEVSINRASHKKQIRHNAKVVAVEFGILLQIRCVDQKMRRRIVEKGCKKMRRRKMFKRLHKRCEGCKEGEKCTTN